MIFCFNKAEISVDDVEDDVQMSHNYVDHPKPKKLTRRQSERLGEIVKLRSRSRSGEGQVRVRKVKETKDLDLSYTMFLAAKTQPNKS